MSKTSPSTSTTNIVGVSQIEVDLAAPQILSQTAENYRDPESAQAVVDNISRQLAERQNPARVAGSLLGNLRGFINYLFGSRKEKPDTKIEDARRQKIDNITDSLVEEKRHSGAKREFHIRTARDDFYYQKPNMSLDNAKLRAELEKHKAIIAEKGDGVSQEDYLKYAEALLNLYLNQQGSGFLYETSNLRIRTDELSSSFFSQRNSELQKETEHAFTRLQKFDNPTAESEFQTGFFFLNKGARKPAAQHFTEALKLKKAHFASLSEEEKETQAHEMKWFHHFAAIFAPAPQAKILLEQELAINPNHQSHEILGIIYQREHKFDRALHHLHEASKINPEAKSLNLRIAQCLVKKGETEKALEHLDREIVISRESNDPWTMRDAILTKAHLKAKSGDYDTAIALLEEVTEHSKQLLSRRVDNNEFDVTIDRAYFYLGKSEQAKKNGEENSAKEYEKRAYDDLNSHVSSNRMDLKVLHLDDFMKLAELEMAINGFENARLRTAKAAESANNLLDTIHRHNNRVPLENGNGYRVYNIQAVGREIASLLIKEAALIYKHLEIDKTINPEDRKSLLEQASHLASAAQDLTDRKKLGHKLSSSCKQLSKIIHHSINHEEKDQPSPSPQTKHTKANNLRGQAAGKKSGVEQEGGKNSTLR